MKLICDLLSAIMPPLPTDPMDHLDHLPLLRLFSPVVYNSDSARKEVEDDV